MDARASPVAWAVAIGIAIAAISVVFFGQEVGSCEANAAATGAVSWCGLGWIPALGMVAVVAVVVVAIVVVLVIRSRF